MPDHARELRQPRRVVGGAFLPADVEVGHAVAVQIGESLLGIRRVVDPGHRRLTGGDHRASAHHTALLNLVPLPAEDGGQPGEGRDPPGPLVGGQVRLQYHRRARHVLLEPGDRRRVLVQRVTLAVARLRDRGHEGRAIERMRRIRVPAIREACRGRRDRVDQGGGDEEEEGDAE